MPWTETCPMDQRVALIADWLRDEWSVTELVARRRGSKGRLAQGRCATRLRYAPTRFL